jgi:hypothetical protein
VRQVRNSYLFADQLPYHCSTAAVSF